MKQRAPNSPPLVYYNIDSTLAMSQNKIDVIRTMFLIWRLLAIPLSYIKDCCELMID